MPEPHHEHQEPIPKNEIGCLRELRERMDELALYKKEMIGIMDEKK